MGLGVRCNFRLRRATAVPYTLGGVADQEPISFDAELLQIAEQWVALRKRPALVFRAGMIHSETPLRVYEALDGRKFDELDVLVDSPGGSPDAAFQTANLIRGHAEKASAVVPFWAKSAATLLSISMDDLILSELAQLGPLDTQVKIRSDRQSPRRQSALEIVRAMRETQQSALQLWHLAATMVLVKQQLTVHGAYELASSFVGHVSGKNFSPVQLEHFGESVRNLEITKDYAKSLLRRHRKLPEGSASRIANKLVEGYASHGSVIDVPELVEIGLEARPATPSEESILNRMRAALMPLYDLDEEEESGYDVIHIVPYVPVPASKPAEEMEAKPLQPGAPDTRSDHQAMSVGTANGVTP